VSDSGDTGLDDKGVPPWWRFSARAQGRRRVGAARRLARARRIGYRRGMTRGWAEERWAEERWVRERYVIVLGAAFRDGRDGVSPALVRRARHGARLTRADPERRLLAVGGGAAREAAAIAGIARDAGVPAARILVERRSRNTLQNAVLVARILARRGHVGGWLVTDWPHIPRAWVCFRLAGVRCRPAPVPGTFARPGFWLREAAACALYLGRLPRLLRARRQRPTRPRSDGGRT
jgi:uncharacterized SAM-binding protein YcdF (DUF218 family)